MNTDRIFKLAISKIDKFIKNQPNKFPYYTTAGKWETTSTTTADDWVSGFWIGVLWIVYLLTSNDKYKTHAIKLMDILDDLSSERTDFDLGFLYCPSFVLGYGITEESYMRETALKAANRMLKQFNKETGFLFLDMTTWVEKTIEKFGRTSLPEISKTLQGKKIGLVFIDVMPNLKLLWWAYNETKKRRYYSAAYRHSLETMENLVRDNGSTFHIAFFDSDNGEVLHRGTLQGYNDNSCWSRGQAWAICGFSLAYEFTQDETFNATLEKLSKYFIRNLLPEGAVYYDFLDPNIPNVPKDTSASVIACSGFRQHSNFKQSAQRILNSMSMNYLQPNDKDGILGKGCFYNKAKIGVNECLVWGDYFYLENFTKRPYRIF